MAVRVGGKVAEPEPGDALQPFLTAWSRGDDRGAARLTDAPDEAARVLVENRRGLDGASLRARVVRLREAEDGRSARARLRLDWRVPVIGAWGYETEARLVRAAERWRVDWGPTIVHPFVDGVARLGTTRDPARRGRIVDRVGRAVVTERAVTRVGVEAGEVDAPATTARQLGRVLDVDARSLAAAIRAAGPAQFVEAALLRRADYRRRRGQLRGIDGLTTVEGTAPLSPSRGFARALLGTVALATAEQLEALGDTARPGDLVGQSGLQAALARRLGGAPSRRVVLRVDGTARDTLLERGGAGSKTVRTTLSVRAQRAAESALGGRSDEAALVAVQPSTGDVLAVANRPTGSTFDRAVEGRYPPGSTFKVVSTAALVRDGLSAGDTVACPRTLRIGGRPFRNFEGGGGGAPPFAQDFAQSCNTAFASLAPRLGATDLRSVARDYGLGEPLKLPVAAPRASVPRVDDVASRAAAMIGQDRVLASPLSMAGVAAAVADGRWRAPRLLSTDSRRAGRALPARERDTLRTLMRRVVTGGTGVAVRDVPGAVRGKSGTAEFGDGEPLRTHAWFIAYRDDLAVAVLVENGSAGGKVAAPIAARFLRALQ